MRRSSDRGLQSSVQRAESMNERTPAPLPAPARGAAAPVSPERSREAPTSSATDQKLARPDFAVAPLVEHPALAQHRVPLDHLSGAQPRLAWLGRPSPSGSRGSNL